MTALWAPLTFLILCLSFAGALYCVDREDDTLTWITISLFAALFGGFTGWLICFYQMS